MPEIRCSRKERKHVRYSISQEDTIVDNTSDTSNGQKVTRRDFMTTGAAGVAAAGVLLSGGYYCATEKESSKGAVDCHIHLWAEDRERFPFHPNAPYIPDQVSTIEQYMEDREGSGVDIGIFVHAEPYQDDHRYVLYCLEKEPVHLRGTCLFDPNDPRSPERMEELVKGKPFVAARIHSYAPERLPQWGSPVLHRFWEKIGELGMVVQIHMIPLYARQLKEMVEAHPDVSVVIDHLGRAAQGTGVEYQVIMDLHKNRNVHIKIASVDSQSKEGAPYWDIWPLLHRLAELFTPQRMVWGDSYKGGMGTEAYARSMNIVHEAFAHLPERDRMDILGGTARRLYRL